MRKPEGSNEWSWLPYGPDLAQQYLGLSAQSPSAYREDIAASSNPIDCLDPQFLRHDLVPAPMQQMRYTEASIPTANPDPVLKVEETPKRARYARVGRRGRTLCYRCQIRKHGSRKPCEAADKHDPHGACSVCVRDGVLCSGRFKPEDRPWKTGHSTWALTPEESNRASKRPGHGLDLLNDPSGRSAAAAKYAEALRVAAPHPRSRGPTTPAPFTPITQFGAPTPLTSPAEFAGTVGVTHHEGMLRAILREMFVDASDEKIESAIEKAMAVMEDRDSDVSWNLAFGM